MKQKSGDPLTHALLGGSLLIPKKFPQLGIVCERAVACPVAIEFYAQGFDGFEAFPRQRSTTSCLIERVNKSAAGSCVVMCPLFSSGNGLCAA